MAAFDARRDCGSADSGQSASPAFNKRRLVGKAAARREKMIAFGYYGGKFSHLDFILPLLPDDYQHYCEPFGGSAAILINRLPAPVETYNDLDSEVVNFFRVLRDDSDVLIRRIALTPFSREEIVLANKREPVADPVERARRFFVRARQTRTGLAQTSTEGRWAHCVLTSRAGMAGAVSRWLGSVEGLAQIVQRLQRVQIENAPAVEVIRRYDSARTLFYCDPPYPHESRGDSKAYGYELSDQAHEELANALHTARGAVAVSGYSCELMNRLYRDWVRIDAPPHLCNSSKSERIESVWLNYPVPAAALTTAAERQLVLQVNQPMARYGASRRRGARKN